MISLSVKFIGFYACYNVINTETIYKKKIIIIVAKIRLCQGVKNIPSIDHVDRAKLFKIYPLLAVRKDKIHKLLRHINKFKVELSIKNDWFETIRY